MRKIRENVLQQLEFMRNLKKIGGGLEAQVTIAAPEPVYSLLDKYRDQLRYLFIVSDVSLKPWESANGSAAGTVVSVDVADGAKCDRCWNYSTRVGEDKAYPTVCERCSAVLKELEGQV